MGNGIIYADMNTINNNDINELSYNTLETKRIDDIINDMNFDESFPKKGRTYKTIIKHLNYMNADSDFKIAFDVLFSKYIKI